MASSAQTQEEDPFFSIVLPTYGVAEYIGQMLECLQAQTFANWEAIVVDDASPDESAQIAQIFANADPRIRVLHHQVNKGASAARNTGIKEARGRYITFFDPDDTCESTLLEEVALSLDRQQAQVVLFGHTEDFYDAHDNSPNSSIEYTLEAKQCGTFSDPSQFRTLVLSFETGVHYGYPWNKFYELNYLRDRQLSFEDEPLNEDIQFNIKVFQDIETLNVIEKPLYHYAKREADNLTNKFVPRYYELHRKRIQSLVDQQRSWGLLDDRARSILGGLYARFIVSALERNLEAESGMSRGDRRAWVQALFEDPLFNELIPFAHANSTLLNIAFKPLKARSVKGTLLLGSVVHAAKRRAAGVLRKVKVKR